MVFWNKLFDLKNKNAKLKKISTKEVIDKLGNYFKDFELIPPANETTIEKIKEYYPILNHEIIDFYKFCNGFNVHIKDYATEWYGQIMSLETHLEQLEIFSSEKYPLYQTLFPLRTDGSFNYDCLMINKIGNGSVVFWDSEEPEKPDYPLAGNLSYYFNFLSDYLITCYKSNGDIKPEYDIDTPNAKEHPWPFNKKWIADKDPIYRKLIVDKEYNKLFNQFY